jgi:hypothetical protein
MLLVVAGCGPAIVKLDRANVRSIKAEVAGGGTSVCVRDDAPQLVARVLYSNGRSLQSATPRVRAGTFQPSERGRPSSAASTATRGCTCRSCSSGTTASSRST